MSEASWLDRVQRLTRRITDDEVFGRAAQLSYYFLLALFPLLLCLISLLGYFVEEGTEFRNKLLGYVATVMPSTAATLVRTTLDEIAKSKGGGKLSFGLLAALWAASNGMGAISQTLNTAYNVRETRPWWKVRLISILLTIALSILIIAALAIILYGGTIGDAFAARYGFGDLFRSLWQIVQWPIALFFVLATFTLIYNYAPDISAEERRWFPPGSLVGVTLWLGISFLFRIYLHFFDSYSVTYGSLGALIVLMLWFYLTGVAILIGGEINCEAEGRCKQNPSEAVRPINT
jgi:membrane protein